MMTTGADLTLFNTLLHEPESQTLDFKRDQYRFYNATDIEKAKLLKDILAFANAWKSTDANILIGVEEVSGGKATPCGVTDHLKDNDLQQFVNTKTNKNVHFLCGTVAFENNQVDYIRIDACQERPIYLVKAFGGLKKNVVYIRHGSSTAEASPQEIAEIGRNESGNVREIPSLHLEFANYENREILGKGTVVTSVRLVDPPLLPRDQLPEALKYLGLEKIRRVSGTKLTGSMTFSHDNLMLGPSKKELRTYREEMALLNPVGFYVHNAGAQTARNVEVVVNIPFVANVTIIDRCNLPQKPQSSLRMVSQTMPPLFGVSVGEHKDHWEVHLTVGNLQPKAICWIEPDLLVGTLKPTTIQLTAKLFSDDVPNPPEVEMTLQIEVVERIYRESDYKADNA